MRQKDLEPMTGVQAVLDDNHVCFLCVSLCKVLRRVRSRSWGGTLVSSSRGTGDNLCQVLWAQLCLGFLLCAPSCILAFASHLARTSLEAPRFIHHFLGQTWPLFHVFFSEDSVMSRVPWAVVIGERLWNLLRNLYGAQVKNRVSVV